MKRTILSFALFCAAVINLLAVEVSITMSSTSRTMTLATKDEGTPVAVGEPTSYVYTFNADPGDYILTGYNSTGTATGTLEISIHEDGEQQDGGGQDGKIFRITTVTAYASNSGWTLGTDYDLTCHATSREGIARTLTTTDGSVTAGRRTFLMHIGDSYRLEYSISETHTEEGYLATFNHSNTVTAATAIAGVAIPLSAEYSITIPESATLFVGWKWGALVTSSGGTHYVPFVEEEPTDQTTQNGKTTYHFRKMGKNCVYNYRVSQPNKLTHGGIFKITDNATSLEITAEMMDSQNSQYINHDVTANAGANVADILTNINAEGHLKMKSNDTYQLLNLRSWQLTDNSTNNYFIEPDFHYTAIGLDGQPSNTVIEIDENQTIKAKGQGTAIVQVTYDAINLRIHNDDNNIADYYYGALWSAIWPENTGTFVVTVDEVEDPAIKRNMYIQQELDESGKNTSVDTEHDVFYYLKGQDGYSYTFTPEGVTSVSIANPTMDTNISKYTTGFQEIAPNEDGSYTVLFTFGRNIIKLTSASGASEYQVVSAKPVTYNVVNMTNPNESIQPGDEVRVQFNGFFHPANKLAGIYNMSTYIVYNGIPNGSALILGPGQYQFGGMPEAQWVNAIVPADWDTTNPFMLQQGALQINGFGSQIGKHRDISINAGINPNFTAIVHVDYFGAIPDIPIVVQPTDYYEVNFSGMPEGATLTVFDRNKTEMPNAENTKYNLTYGTYTYTIQCDGHRVYRSDFSISSESPETQTITVLMEATGENGWDGETLTAPAIVSAEESNTEGGQFEDMEGYYKITSGYELAWLADKTNTATSNTTNNAVLANDIDLANYIWTPIGKNTPATQQYRGTFNGGNFQVKGLYIDYAATTAAYQGLFAYINASTIKNLTVSGKITSTTTNTNSYTGGIIAYSTGASTIENCRNEVTVSGKGNVGGIVGYAAAASLTIINCHNTGNITASASNAGGIAANLASPGTNTIINKVSNTGNITSTASIVGGIIGGAATAPITNAYNRGDVTGTITVGGIAGSSTGSITNAYNQGNVTGGANTAGIAGGTNASGNITNAYNSGTITPTTAGGYIGAIIGLSSTGTFYGIRTNTYTLGEGYSDEPTIKTIEEFNSGEVAWLLGEAFGQELSVDELPVFDGDKVYQVTYTNNMNDEIDTSYTNGSLATIEETAGFSTTWYTEKDGEILTEVLDNSNLYRFYVDIAAPSIPTDLEGIATETNIALTWTASTDNVGVIGYNLYLDDELESFVIETNYLIRRLSSAAEYTIEVEAIDAAGNKSDKALIIVKTLGGTNIPSIENTIHVYPNPFVDYIIVNATVEGVVTVYDLFGRVVLTQTVNAGKNRIDTSALSQGTYLLKQGSKIVKIVK